MANTTTNIFLRLRSQVQRYLYTVRWRKGDDTHWVTKGTNIKYALKLVTSLLWTWKINYLDEQSFFKHNFLTKKFCRVKNVSAKLNHDTIKHACTFKFYFTIAGGVFFKFKIWNRLALHTSQAVFLDEFFPCLKTSYN